MPTAQNAGHEGEGCVPATKWTLELERGKHAAWIGVLPSLVALLYLTLVSLGFSKNQPRRSRNWVWVRFWSGKNCSSGKQPSGRESRAQWDPRAEENVILDDSTDIEYSDELSKEELETYVGTPAEMSASALLFLIPSIHE